MAERFAEKVHPEPNSGCWLWTGCVNQRMRPYIGVCNGSKETLLAYRVAWMLHRGEIPEGLRVCHRCDLPLCENPDHLFLGTQADNLRDMVKKGRNRVSRPNRATSKIKTKINANDVLIIRTSADDNKMLAKQFGVTPANIGYIKRGNTWRHLKGKL